MDIFTIAKLVDGVLQIQLVRWLLLLVTVVLLVMATWLGVRIKALQTSLMISEASNQSYIAAAQVADGQRKQLEARITEASRDIATIKAGYEARMKKLRATTITPAKCEDMVAQSVRILQEGE